MDKDVIQQALDIIAEFLTRTPDRNTFPRSEVQTLGLDLWGVLREGQTPETHEEPALR